jgi:phosphoglycerate dehydrogenase-like enzyme
MRILFASHHNALGGFLESLRHELPQHEFEASGRFAGFDSLKGYDVLIPRRSVVNRQSLETADRLRLIQQCGAGIENIDIMAARDRNIWVANVRSDISGNADSVAEIGIYLMIGLSRDFRNMELSIANRRVGIPRGRALSGKTVGIVGLGGIGGALSRRLKAFDCNVVGIKRHDLQKTKRELGLNWVGTPAQMKDFLKMSDYVVLCLPLTSENRNMIGSQTFDDMKPYSFLINLSRGGLVDRSAMQEALASGKIAGAGLDVFWEEPVNPDDPIFKYNVLATPHVGGVTDISIQGIVKVVVENIRRLENDQEPLCLK